MGWKKSKTDAGEIYTLAENVYKLKYALEVGLESLNQDDSPYSMIRDGLGPYVYERTKPSEKDSLVLPTGVYSVKADNHYENPVLHPITLSHDKVLFELDVVKEVLKDFESFIISEPIYRKLGVIYKRGILLYGPPGTGKTTAIQMILQSLKVQNGIVFYITDEIPTSFIKELKNDIRLKIIVFEELVTTVKKSNMQRFLTFLDGENSLDNTYIIATTNYPEELPTNVVNRPGRFDTMCCIESLKKEDRKTYLEYLLDRDVSPKELEQSDNLSIAQLKEIALIVLKEQVTLQEAIDKIKIHSKLVHDNFKKKKDREIGFNSED